MSSQSSLVIELNGLIEQGDVKKAKEILAKNQEIETVFLPFPPSLVNGKPLTSSIIEAVKKNNLEMIQMLFDYDDSFVCEEEEEEEKRNQGFSSFSWSNSTVGYNALHIASSLGYAEACVALLAMGMDCMTATDETNEFSVYKRFSPLHLASLNNHLHIFQTFLYFLKNRQIVTSYVKKTLKTFETEKSSFSLLPSHFITSTPQIAKPIYDDYGSLVNSQQLEQSRSENTNFSPDDFIGDIDNSKSFPLFNMLLNKRNADGETPLQVAIYYRRDSIVNWILSLAIHSNTLFLQHYGKILVRKLFEASQRTSNATETRKIKNTDFDAKLHSITATTDPSHLRSSEQESDEEEDSEDASEVSSQCSSSSASSASSSSLPSSSSHLSPLHNLISPLELKQKRILVDLDHYSHSHDSALSQPLNTSSHYTSSHFNQKKRQSLSPLMIAASRGFPEIVSALLHYHEVMKQQVDIIRMDMLAIFEMESSETDMASTEVLNPESLSSGLPQGSNPIHSDSHGENGKKEGEGSQQEAASQKPSLSHSKSILPPLDPYLDALEELSEMVLLKLDGDAGKKRRKMRRDLDFEKKASTNNDEAHVPLKERSNEIESQMPVLSYSKDESDSVIHLACQSQLQRVFNYNYEMNDDHYECLYQLVMRGSEEIDIRRRNKDGNFPFDLLLLSPSCFFLSLYNLSLASSKLGWENFSLLKFYPTLRGMLEAVKEGPHAIRSIPINALYAQIESFVNSNGIHSDNDKKGSSPGFSHSKTSSHLSSSFNSSISSPFKISIVNDILPIVDSLSKLETQASYEDFKFIIPSMPLLLTLATDLHSIIFKQEMVLEEEDAKPCKLIDTTKEPKTLKFWKIKRRSLNGNEEEGGARRNDGKDGIQMMVDENGKLQAFGEEEGSLKSGGAEKDDSDQPPSGHPDISKYPPGSVCPMGFGKKKPTPHQDASSSSSSQTSSSSDQPPSGHPDVSKYPPGSVCPMGFGKKKVEPKPDDVDDEQQKKGHASSETHSNRSSTGGWMTLDSVIILGATGLIASLALFRLFNLYSSSTTGGGGGAGNSPHKQ
jgi:ankyrin repeat protein